jgi:hypothetical protein
MDEQQLRYVYEDGLQVLPTYPVVLGHPGFWWKKPDTGVDWVRIVHGEQGLIIHKLPPPEGELIGRTRVTGIVDKGAGKGIDALMPLTDYLKLLSSIAVMEKWWKHKTMNGAMHRLQNVSRIHWLKASMPLLMKMSRRLVKLQTGHSMS